MPRPFGSTVELAAEMRDHLVRARSPLEHSFAVPADLLLRANGEGSVGSAILRAGATRCRRCNCCTQRKPIPPPALPGVFYRNVRHRQRWTIRVKRSCLALSTRKR